MLKKYPVAIKIAKYIIYEYSIFFVLVNFNKIDFINVDAVANPEEIAIGIISIRLSFKYWLYKIFKAIYVRGIDIIVTPNIIGIFASIVSFIILF